MIEAIGKVAALLANLLTFGFLTKRIQVVLTRPANIDPYAATDTIVDTNGLVITFLKIARTGGGSGYITGLRFGTNQPANISEYNLHLFRLKPAIVIADSALWVEKETDVTIKIATINIPVIAKVGAAGTIAIQEISGLRIPYEAASGTKNIVAQLETVTGFIPDFSQKFYIELIVDQG